MKVNKNRTFILKPEAGAEGSGIFLTQNFKQIPISAFQKRYIAQEYLAEPYLVDGKKFDLRIYVMVTSLGSGASGDHPLTAFIADEGLVRFCTEDYQKPDKDNLNILLGHLTNYSLNKQSDNYNHSEGLGHEDQAESSKRTLSSVFQLLTQEGINTGDVFERIK